MSIITHIRTADGITQPVCAICDRDSHIAVIPAEACELRVPVSLLYSAAVSDAEIMMTMDALGMVIHGPFRALGITPDQVREAAAVATLLLDYTFDRVQAGPFAVRHLTVERVRVC